MNEWYHTAWGIILLGALGSILGVIFLKITVIVLKKLGPSLLMRFFSNIFMRYAENKYFVQKCEENGRTELIAINYSIMRSNYTKAQFLFIVVIGICFIMWSSYLFSDEPNIIIPILFTLFAIKDFYNFITWYMATLGCLPEDMMQYIKEIEKQKKKDKFKFIENAVINSDS